MSNNNGKTTCKEVCSNCKCIVVEKPLKQKEKQKEEKKDCVATIVGVLSLPENFCCDKKEEKKEDKKKEIKQAKKDDCTEVYRDLGECLQKCIVQGAHNGHGGQNAKGKKQSDRSLDC